MHWKDLCWSSKTLATWCEEPTHWKWPWHWEILKAGGEREDRGWDGWMASSTQQTWVWANSGRWWRTVEPGMLWSMGWQRVRNDWATEQQQNPANWLNLFTEKYVAKSLQSCPTLCDPRDGSPPGSPVPGILQARTLEWVAVSFSKAWKWKVKVKPFSRVWLLATPWTAAYQAPLSMGFSRQEYWSGVPLPSTTEKYSLCIIIYVNFIGMFHTEIINV